MAEEKEIIHKVEIINNDVSSKITNHSDHNLQRFWRPAVAICYLLICVFDFIIAPSWVGMNQESTSETILAIKDLPVETQIIFAQKTNKWEPLTLMGGGMFHLAFGAILTGAAVTRGMEKTAKVKTVNTLQSKENGTLI